jgi:hypothetical protein
VYQGSIDAPSKYLQAAISVLDDLNEFTFLLLE